jgi:hypothetical protein
LWWSVELTEPAAVVVSTRGSDFDTVVALWEDTAEGLQPVGCNDDTETLQSSLDADLDAGRRYLVQVGGFASSAGHLELSASRIEYLGNDDIADAVSLGAPFDITFDLSPATADADEPLPCDRYLIDKTVWFSVTPDTDATLEVFTGYDHIWGVYADTADGLQALGCGQQQGAGYAGVPVPASQPLLIQVGVSDLAAPGVASLMGRFIVSPPNDHIADAAELSPGQPVSGTTFGSTMEEGEPICQNGYGSVWYAFTAAEDTSAQVTTTGGDTTLAVYEGTGYGDLAQRGCSVHYRNGNGGHVALDIVAGQTYLIQVAAHLGWWDDFDVVVDVGDSDGVDLAGLGDADFDPESGDGAAVVDAGLGSAHLERRKPRTAASAFLLGTGAFIDRHDSGGGVVGVCANALVTGTCIATWSP